MENKKIKWLIYTVIVGLIPILLRLLVSLLTKPGTITMFTASDFISFGLVLHISNINEIEHIGLQNEPDKAWKTIQNGLSILFISFYSVFFALTLLNESPNSLIEIKIITRCTIILSFVSFLISYSIYDRISYLYKRGIIK